jgi:hypothetical protein
MHQGWVLRLLSLGGSWVGFLSVSRVVVIDMRGVCSWQVVMATCICLACVVCVCTHARCLSTVTAVLHCLMGRCTNVPVHWVAGAWAVHVVRC